MNNERYNQIVEEAYTHWMKEWCNGRIYPHKNDKSFFINLIKTDKQFSNIVGLTIEEKELSDEERFRLYVKIYNPSYPINVLDTNEFYKIMKIPTKLITISYKDEKLEVYE